MPNGENQGEAAMEGPEVHVPHAPHTGHRWWDFAIGGTALLVSVISLYVAVHHGEIMEKLVAANSWPNVQLSTNVGSASAPDRVRFEIALTNNGVGPARVETVELWTGNTPIVDANQIGKLIKANGGGQTLNVQVEGATVIGSVLGARETIVPLSIATTDRERWGLAMVKTAAAMESRVCFCSVFDECHIADSRTKAGRPARVDACPAAPTSFRDDIAGLMIARLPATTPPPGDSAAAAR